MMRGKKIKN